MSLYNYYIYRIYLDKKNLQYSAFDRFTNYYACTFDACFNVRKYFEFNINYLALFEVLHIDENCLLGSYGSGPAKENEYVKNRDYNKLEVIPKTGTSMTETVFYIDFEKQLLFYIDIGNVIGFGKNLKKIVQERKIRLEKIILKDWQKQIKNLFKEIEFLEFKEQDYDYEPPLPELLNKNIIYKSSKYSINITVTDFLAQISQINIADDFELFKVTGKLADSNPKSIDLIEDSIRAKKTIELKSSCFKDLKENKDYFLNTLKSATATVAVAGNILLEDMKDVI